MRDQVFNITQISAALGMSQATASRMAAAGRFGKPIIKRKCKRKFYSRAVIERAIGHPLSAEQIARATEARDASHRTHSEIKTDFIRRFLAIVCEARDQRWLTALREQSIKDFTAPRPVFHHDQH